MLLDRAFGLYSVSVLGIFSNTIVVVVIGLEFDFHFVLQNC